MGLLDSIPGMGFDASSTGTAGLLTPQDKLMALFSGLTNAGVMMAQPGLGKGQALAMGLGGLGQGIQRGNQMALQQQLMAGKLAEEQRKLAAQKVLDQAYGGNLATPGPSVASMSGMPVAEGMAARIGQSRDDALSKPEVQQALLSLYGPQGLAALQSAQKAPETVEGNDPTSGQPIRYMFNRQSGKYDIPVGGPKVDATKPIYNPETKRWDYAPGVIDAEAGKTGAVETAQQRAQLMFAGPKAGAAAAATAPFDIQKAWAIPRVLPPGGQVVAGGGSPDQPARVIMTSPNPAPGSQEGKYNAGVGELQSKTVEGWRSGAEAGFVTQQNVQRMREAVDNGLQTGTFAPMRQATVTALADLGVPQQSLDKYFNAKDAKSFDAAAKELVLPVIKTLGANPTNTDRDFIEKTIPQLRDNPEAVKSLLDWMDKKAQSKIDLYEQGYAHASGGGDPLKFEQEWWKKQRAPKPAAASPPAGSTPPAEQSKVIGGKTYVKRNGQWFEQ